MTSKSQKGILQTFAEIQGILCFYVVVVVVVVLYPIMKENNYQVNSVFLFLVFVCLSVCLFVFC